MMANEEKNNIGNNLIKIYNTLDRLYNCTFPRGILNSYQTIESLIASLKYNKFSKTFEKEFGDIVIEQNKYSKTHYNSCIIEKLIKEPIIETLESEAKRLVNINILNFITEDTLFITSEFEIKSRKTSKNKLLENAIANCKELSLISKDSNFKLLEDYLLWLTKKQKDLEKI